MKRSKLVLIGFVAATLMAVGGYGCSKSSCEKLRNKVVDCMEEFCADNEDSPVCSDEAREAGMEALEERMPDECEGEVEEQARAGLELSCETLTGGIRGAAE